MQVPQANRLLSPDFLRFFLGSGGGLLVDLGGFALLNMLGLAPGAANLISSFTSITIVYGLVSRYAFGTRATPRSYLAFVAWYASSIAVFSVLIELAATSTGLPPMVCKLAAVPLSFALNYLFSRRLFRPSSPRTGPSPGSYEEDEHDGAARTKGARSPFQYDGTCPAPRRLVDTEAR